MLFARLKLQRKISEERGGQGHNWVGVFRIAIWGHSGVLIYYLVRRISGFRWTLENLMLIVMFVGLAGLVLIAVELLPFWPGLVVALIDTAIGSWFSLVQLVRLVPRQWIPQKLQPLVYFVLRNEPQVAAPAADRVWGQNLGPHPWGC